MAAFGYSLIDNFVNVTREVISGNCTWGATSVNCCCYTEIDTAIVLALICSKKRATREREHSLSKRDRTAFDQSTKFHILRLWLRASGNCWTTPMTHVRNAFSLQPPLGDSGASCLAEIPQSHEHSSHRHWRRGADGRWRSPPHPQTR